MAASQQGALVYLVLPEVASLTTTETKAVGVKEDKGTGSVLPMQAASKAAAEVVSRAIGDAAGGVSSTIGDIFGGLVGDRIRDWRTRNLIEIASRTSEILRSHNVPLEQAKSLPMGDIYCLFEGASKADHPDLMEMWSKLLASSMTGDGTGGELPAITRVLEQLLPADANLLRLIAYCDAWSDRYLELTPDESKAGDESEEQKARRQQIGDLLVASLQSEYDKFKTLHGEHEKLSLDNLIRFNCITIATPHIRAKRDQDGNQYMLEDMVQPPYGVGSPKAVKSGFEDRMKFLLDQIVLLTGGSAEKEPLFHDLIGLYPFYKLTFFGQRLVKACGVAVAIDVPKPKVE